MTQKKIYEQYAPIIRAHYEPIWLSYEGRNLSREQFASLLHHLTNDWTSFYQRYERTAKNLFHTIGPTKGGAYQWVILDHIEAAFGKRITESEMLMAHFLGLNQEEYARWRTSYDVFMNK